MTNRIDRKTAEAARRRVIEIDRTPCSCSRGGSAAYCEHRDTDDERAACVKLWNEFCAEETKRLAEKPMRINPMVALFGG